MKWQICNHPKKTIKKFNELKEKKFELINKKRRYLEINSTYLLNPKFIIMGKNIIISNFVIKWKIQEKIIVRIIRNSSYGYYQIKVYNDYKKFMTKIK